MEIVVLNSDIARLVLDYLKSQKLNKATHTFCKTSPYLKQEFSAYKQGLQTHSFFPELEEIICEYVKISRKVEQLLPKLTDALRSQFQQCKLSEKVNELLERGSQAILASNLSTNKTDLKSSTSIVSASQEYNTVDENELREAKRKRSFENSNNSSNDAVTDNTNKRHRLTSARLSHYSKKRRVLQPYCFLSSKALQRHKSRYYSKISTSTTDEDIEEEEIEEESECSIEEREIASACGEALDANENCDEDEMFNGEKPTKESTPRNKPNRKGKTNSVPPILPDISQAILDNPEFQQKLVENINQALNKSTVSTDTTLNALNTDHVENINPPLGGIPPLTGEEITSSQLLDQMIKNILDATEKEPSFNDIVQEVVGTSNKPQVQLQSAAIQCNINATNIAAKANAPSYTVTEPPRLVPAQPATQLHLYPAPTSPTQTGTVTTTRSMVNIASTSVPPPRTPVIIRSAPGVVGVNSSVSSGTSGLSAQDPPSMMASNSFGPLIDPNFSISKLIVLNSNDSAQKHHPENCIGNTTADNIISQLSTSGVVDPNDEQVYFDTTTGQLTFPIFLTNDGLLTNFPFLINNEIVSQQLQTNSLGNLDGSRLEIPLSEPIVVSANQLPPNSIILSSAVKEPVAENPETVEKTTKETVIKPCNTVPPTSSDNSLLYDKATPSTSGVVNTKAFKSLSTPRKRTSHVRTLTFSPRNPQSLTNVGTPLSTRREAITRFQKSLPKVIPGEDKGKTEEIIKKFEEKETNTSEKAVIKTVEILPTIASSANATTSESLAENTNVSANETGNIPPLFVSEESSNQTIINKPVAASKDLSKESLKPKALTNFSKSQTTASENTPKRKQFRKTAVRSCKRQLAKSSNEEDLLEKEKAEKENEKTTESTEQAGEKPANNDMMQEWIRLRNSSVDLDVRLREINASSQSKQVKKVNTKKRVRRKKPAAIKKKEKELAKEAGELELNNDSEEQLMDQQIDEQTKLLDKKQVDQTYNEKQDIGENAMKAENTPIVEENVNQPLVEKKSKVPSVQNGKGRTTEKTAKPDKKPKEKHKKSDAIVKQETSIKNAVVPTIQSPDSPEVPHAVPLHVNEALEREKRTTNMAFLLETPFKDPNLTSCIPPTPGIFAPTLETPSSKLKDPHDEMQASASFLFGSITKSELGTPLISAITPGFRFTPFGMKDIGTPKSIPGTDYSSGGGSYYKPDESEDLDRNIDKMLRNSAQKKIDSEDAKDNDKVEREDREEGEIVEEQVDNEGSSGEVDKIKIEIPAEKLKVEPIVLKRVKSFSNEAVDCIETAQIDPHYTLVSGLPEISAAEEESSSSSSSSSGSSPSSKSSSSASSPSSSSSSSSSSSNDSVKSKTVIEVAESNKKVNINNLENLSEISSTEDEEWQKLAVTDNDENSQLVSHDGEVRYPVRSWLTPIKENMIIETKTFAETEVTESTTSAKPATIKVTLPLKSAEKRNRQVRELELKKQRIKEKLKNDATTTTKKEKPTTAPTAAPNISAALAASRMLYAMRDKGKKPMCFQTENSTETTAVDMPQSAQDKRSIDVLTALNLSAKKLLPKTPENPQKPTPSQADDIAMAISPDILKGKSKLNTSPSTSNKTPQRKCLPIEARPVTRTIRKTGKKIVRTPLAFKVIHSPGKINIHSTTTTLAEFAATKTLNKSKETASPFIQQTLRVSPRLMKPTKLRGKKPAESPVQKTKANTRNAKAKATAVAAKPKVTRTRNNKKKELPRAPLEKDIKELLKDWEDESLEEKNYEEFIDETEDKSAASIKPKIHLKARNAMISAKPKTVAKREELTAIFKVEATKKTESNVLAEEVQTKKPPELRKNYVAPEPINTEPPIIVIPPAAAEKGDCFDDDDDPLVDCEISTSNETDTKRFITYTYSGPDGPPAIALQPHDFSNFQMVIAIDENEKHVWSISEGICLYSCAPSLDKSVPATIPKKRKIRATTVTTVMSEKTAVTTNTKIAALKAFSINNPVATSTPLAIQGSTSRTTTENGKSNATKEAAGGGCKSKTTTKAQPVEAVKNSIPDSSNETPKIQIEDIESILSHLHGT